MDREVPLAHREGDRAEGEAEGDQDADEHLLAPARQAACAQQGRDGGGQKDDAEEDAAAEPALDEQLLERLVAKPSPFLPARLPPCRHLALPLGPPREPPTGRPTRAGGGRGGFTIRSGRRRRAIRFCRRETSDWEDRMNTLLAVVIGVLTVYLAYTLYARRIDRHVIQSDPKRATPATLYMDRVDFMPTNRNILFGYHFKSIAAAGPIVGAIVSATLWCWLPAMIWLVLGVSFIGWASDYSGIVVSVRNEGNSLSAIAHRLVSPRSRTILFVFIFFYLLLVGGAFVGIMAGVLDSQPATLFGIIVLVVMGLLLGQMLYRWRRGLAASTVLTVGVTLAAILGGHWAEGAFRAFNAALDGLTGGAPIVTYF